MSRGAYGDREHRRAVEEHFALVGDLFAELWHPDYFHFALYESGDEPPEQAYERTHRRYLEALRPEQGDHLVVLGCGRGGFAEYLARNTGARVLGVDVSAEQLAHARRREAPRLSFRRRDMIEVDRLGERFDAAVCLDAACYLTDKEVLPAAVRRVLAPGGRFLLVDWCRHAGVNRLQEELLLLPFMECWELPGLETLEGWEGHLRAHGFRVLEARTLGDRARPNWERAYHAALGALDELSPATISRWLGRALSGGEGALEALKDQLRAALYIKAGFDSGVLRYAYLLAEKRDDRRRPGLGAGRRT